jgi:hypothetical protein
MPNITTTPPPTPNFTGIATLCTTGTATIAAQGFEVEYLNGVSTKIRTRAGVTVTAIVVPVGEVHTALYPGGKLGAVCIDCGGKCGMVAGDTSIGALTAGINRIDITSAECPLSPLEIRLQDESKARAAALAIEAKRQKIRDAMG